LTWTMPLWIASLSVMNVAIVEDNQTLLDNLRLLLQGESGCSVTGAWRSAEDALANSSWARTNILLADIDLPGISGVELISQIKAKYPHVDCMAYTVSEDRATVFAAIKAGACGYLLKGSTPRELIEALHHLHEGGAPMSHLSISGNEQHPFVSGGMPLPPRAGRSSVSGTRTILQGNRRGIGDQRSHRPLAHQTHLREASEPKPSGGGAQSSQTGVDLALSF